MIDGKEGLILLGIIVGFLVIFALFVLVPGTVMHDGFSHQFDNGDEAVVFDKDGSVKESFWRMETIRDLWNLPDKQRQRAMHQPAPIKLGESHENPTTE